MPMPSEEELEEHKRGQRAAIALADELDEEFQREGAEGHSEIIGHLLSLVHARSVHEGWPLLKAMSAVARLLFQYGRRTAREDLMRIARKN